MSDEELIERLLAGDTAALAALVEQYSSPVYRLVHRILTGAGTEQDVEECVSDVFHAAWRKIGQYDAAKAPLATWLLILAKYQALERRRELAGAGAAVLPVGDNTLVSDACAPEQELARAERRQEIQAALEQLPPLDRELVYRRYFLEERVDRLAEALALTRQAADNRLWRARKTLRAILQKEAAIDGGGV